MKATVVFLTFVGALALASVVPPQQQQPKVADQDFLQKQYNILKLFMNVNQPNYDQEQAQTGNAFDIRNQMDNFSNSHAIKEFINMCNNHQMLPRGQTFNVHNPQQLQQAIRLFDVFYFAKNYNTFYQAACWAKQHMNEGQYVYALAVAVYNKPDTQGMQTPPMSEIMPHFYVDYQAIQQACQLKQQGQQSANIQSNCTGQYPNWYNNNQQDQPQNPNQPDQPYQPQPYQPNQPDQPYQPEQPDQPGQQTNYPYPYNSNQQQRDYNMQYNLESYMSYYREDPGMNQMYAQMHVQQPFWFNTQKYQANKQQNQGYGENVYYMYQQALARYNLERMTNGLPPVTPITYNQPMQDGYCPNVQYYNGQHFPTRADNMVLQQHANQYILQKVKDCERRIRDAIDSQYAYTSEGAKVKLTVENGVEMLGMMMHANPDAATNSNNNNNYYGPFMHYYGYVQLLKKLVGQVVDPYHQNGAAPGIVENYNTALNDPVMYQILARAVNLIQQFKNQIQPYKQDQVYYQGVKVMSMQTDKLVTYFDTCNINLCNALSYQQGQQAQSYDYKANQLCLNNKPFTYRINVNSDKNEDAIVRVFIGPKYNAQGQPMSLQQAKNHYVEIDRFVTTLKNGQNNIERNSKQSNVFVDDQQQNTRNLFRKVQQAQQGGQPYYYYDNQNAQTGFPERMMLPKGTQNGQQMVMFVIVNKYEMSPNQNQNQALNMYQVQDKNAQGYPFDRQMNENLYSHCPNCYYKEVTVYYKPHNQINSAA